MDFIDGVKKGKIWIESERDWEGGTKGIHWTKVSYEQVLNPSFCFTMLTLILTLPKAATLSLLATTRHHRPSGLFSDQLVAAKQLPDLLHCRLVETPSRYRHQLTTLSPV